MPNWNSNHVTVRNATTEQIQRIIQACERNELLNEFLPQPNWASIPNENGHLPGPRYKVRYRNGRVGVASPEFPDGSSDQRWYDWRTSELNWGTKWEPDVEVTTSSDNSIELYFNTAWCPPSDTWFEMLSSEMPDAQISNSFSEPGCDFFGMQLATAGRCLSKCLEINPLYDIWVKKTLSPEDFAIYEDESHEQNEDISEATREQWYECYYDVIEEALSPLTKALDASFLATA